MHVEASAVALAPVEEVWSWWTDYGPVGEPFDVTHGMGTTRRRVVERSPDRVTIDEELPLPFGHPFRLLRHEIILDAKGHTLHEKGRAVVPFEATWTFESVRDPTPATRITRRVEAHTSLANLAPASVVRRLLERDLLHHIREFEDERKGRAPASSGH